MAVSLWHPKISTFEGEFTFSGPRGTICTAWRQYIPTCPQDTWENLTRYAKRLLRALDKKKS